MRKADTDAPPRPRYAWRARLPAREGFRRPEAKRSTTAISALAVRQIVVTANGASRAGRAITRPAIQV